MIDNPRASTLQFPKALTATAVALFGLAVVAVLIHSSQPDLSAYDIVQLESYDGQQQAPAIFNLTNLDECESRNDCIKKSLTASRTDIAEYTILNNSIREIPAVNATGPDETVRQQSVFESNPVTYLAAEQIPDAATTPDLLEVQKQWSNIRSTPSSSGTIVTSLAKGTRVIILSSTGNWYEIEAINEAKPRGYMHRSTVGSQSH